MVAGAQKVVGRMRITASSSACGTNFGGIVRADGRAADPLAEYLAPGELGPARIGLRHVDVVVLHALPVFCRDDMAEREREVVPHHLGHARGAGGEVDQHRVGINRGRFSLRTRETFACI